QRAHRPGPGDGGFHGGNVEFVGEIREKAVVDVGANEETPVGRTGEDTDVRGTGKGRAEHVSRRSRLRRRARLPPRTGPRAREACSAGSSVRAPRPPR